MDARLPVIGVDFDNTLVSYDELMYEVAVERGLIPLGTKRTKQAIREAVRQSPHGDRAWYGIQTAVYGERIEDARVMDGVPAFFRSCRVRGIRVVIISHKTPYPALGETGPDLRATALAWMRSHQFFAPDGLGLAEADVYFELTRADKVARIRQLGCTHFIDDLSETFLEASFPEQVQKILFARHGEPLELPGVRVMTSWRQISECLFDSSR